MKNLNHAGFDPNQAIQLLEKYGYCTVPSCFPENLVSDIIKDFLNLITLPDKERKKWLVDIGNTGDPDDGLIERNGGLYDHKFFFHYKHPNLADYLQKQKVDLQPWWKFLNSLHQLCSYLILAMDSVTNAFEDKCPKCNLEQRIKEFSGPRGVLRLIYYKPGYAVAAQPHYDRDLFTFHVADSPAGLIVGQENEKSRSIYQPNNNKLLLFPGMKAEIITDKAVLLEGDKVALQPEWKSESLIPAGYHTALNNSDGGRWSIVFFYHCHTLLTNDDLTKLAKQKIKKSLESTAVV